MSEFKVNRERTKVYLEEQRPADCSYHARDFQKYVEGFASRHPVTADEIGIRLLGQCDCDEGPHGSVLDAAAEIESTFHDHQHDSDHAEYPVGSIKNFQDHHRF
jgi:hypothetical protein